MASGEDPETVDRVPRGRPTVSVRTLPPTQRDVMRAVNALTSLANALVGTARLLCAKPLAERSRRTTRGYHIKNGRREAQTRRARRSGSRSNPQPGAPRQRASSSDRCLPERPKDKNMAVKMYSFAWCVPALAHCPWQRSVASTPSSRTHRGATAAWVVWRGTEAKTQRGEPDAGRSAADDWCRPTIRTGKQGIWCLFFTRGQC